MAGAVRAKGHAARRFCQRPFQADPDRIHRQGVHLRFLRTRLPKAKTPHEQEFIQRQVTATDKATDARVCELYGLTGGRSGSWKE